MQKAQTPVLSIYGVDGQLLQTMIIEGIKGQNEVQLSTQALSATGIFMIQLQTNNGVYTNKMIRQ